jgi:hypothetical protein
MRTLEETVVYELSRLAVRRRSAPAKIAQMRSAGSKAVQERARASGENPASLRWISA